MGNRRQQIAALSCAIKKSYLVFVFNDYFGIPKFYFMKRFSAIGALLIAATTIISSCSKNDKSDCPFLSPKMVYVNFSESETDTLIIRKYQLNSGFTKLIDTAIIGKADLVRTIIGKDSVAISSNKPAYSNFSYGIYGYNWEVVLPGNGNQTTRISEVVPQFTQERQPSAQCQSFVYSMNFNGITRKWSSWFGSEYQVYIKK